MCNPRTSAARNPHFRTAISAPYINKAILKCNKASSNPSSMGLTLANTQEITVLLNLRKRSYMNLVGNWEKTSWNNDLRSHLKCIDFYRAKFNRVGNGQSISNSGNHTKRKR